MQDKGMGRILLAFDISPRSRAALETAAALAAEMDTELVGLFVEDVNLLRLGGLPFTREFGFFARDPRPFDQEEVERALRREAEEAQRLLAAAAARLRLRWSFRVVRGRIAVELFALAGEPDLVVLGKRARMGPLLLSDVVAELSPPVAPPRSRPVVEVYDGTPAARRALDLAQRLARAGGMPLRVLIPAETETAFAALADAVAGLQAPAAACRRIPSLEPQALAAAVRQEKAGVLVLAGDGHFRSGEGFSALLNEIDCPVVLLS